MKQTTPQPFAIAWRFLVAAAMLAALHSASAANGSWLGTNDATWAGTNWSASPVPGTGDTATFNGAGNSNTTLNLGSGVTINTILLDTASAAAYTIGSGSVGSQTLTLNNSGAVTMNSTVANNELFNANVVLGTDATTQAYTFTNSSTTNGLTFAGGITGGSTGTAGTKTLTVTGAGNTTISGIIGDGGATHVALTKSSTGTLTLTGPNTYTGATSIGNGILNIQNNTALGTSAGGTSISSGGKLQIQGNITVTGEGLDMSAGGSTFENVSGTNVWTGNITANTNVATTLRVTGGALAVSNIAIPASGGSFSIANNGTLAINGTISGTTAGFSVSGTGTTTISGANTFGDATHGMMINSGTATVQVTDSTTYGVGNQTITNNGLGSSSNIFTFGANTGSSILQLRANGQSDATAQTLTYGNNVVISGASGVNGTINVDRQGGTGTNKTLALGNLTTGGNGGALSVTGANGYGLAVGAVTIGGNGKTATFNPTTANLTIASVTNSATTTADTLKLDGTSAGNAVTGIISDGTSFATNVTKSNTSTWALNGNSTYTGTTTVSAGTLLINGNFTSATNTVTVASTATLGGTGIVGGATSVSDGGTVSAGTGGAGTLAFHTNLTLVGGAGAAGATAVFQAGDLINVTGTLSLASAWNLTVSGTGFQNGGSVTLFNYGTAGTIFTNADITLISLGFTPGALTLTNDTLNKEIILNGISVVPEPATWALLAFSLTTVMVLRRRNSR